MAGRFVILWPELLEPKGRTSRRHAGISTRRLPSLASFRMAAMSSAWRVCVVPLTRRWPQPRFQLVARANELGLRCRLPTPPGLPVTTGGRQNHPTSGSRS